MMRALSYSQISLYQSCPLAYKLQYIDGLKPKEKWYFSFGSTLHLCAEYFFRVKAPPPPSLAELLQYYEDNWQAEGYESPEEEMKYKAYGQEILAEFHHIHSPAFHMPLAVEQRFNIGVEGVKLTGYIDRVDKLASGGLSIVDYKSSQQLFTTTHLAQDLQLTLYQLAAEQLWGLPVEKLTLYHLRSNTPCSCQSREEQQLADARRLVVEVAEGIAAQRFPAQENQFCPCDFPEYCPYHRHRYITAETEPAAPGIVTGKEAAQAVEQYVALQTQVKELELKLSEVRQLIVSYCQSEALSRVYGEEHAITYRLVEKTGFPEDEVRALLEPQGLWNTVLSLDPSKLRQLIGDKAVANDIKAKLEAIRQVVSTYPQLFARSLGKEE
jgi:RecB family exonuclease